MRRSVDVPAAGVEQDGIVGAIGAGVFMTDSRQARAEQIKRILGETIGEASLQWEPRPTGVFDTHGASVVRIKAEQRIHEVLEAEAHAAAQEQREADIQMIKESAIFTVLRCCASSNSEQRQKNIEAIRAAPLVTEGGGK